MADAPSNDAWDDDDEATQVPTITKRIKKVTVASSSRDEDSAREPGSAGARLPAPQLPSPSAGAAGASGKPGALAKESHTHAVIHMSSDEPTLTEEDVRAMFDSALVTALEHPRDRSKVLRLEEDILAFMAAGEG